MRKRSVLPQSLISLVNGFWNSSNSSFHVFIWNCLRHFRQRLIDRTVSYKYNIQYDWRWIHLQTHESTNTVEYEIFDYFSHSIVRHGIFTGTNSQIIRTVSSFFAIQNFLAHSVAPMMRTLNGSKKWLKIVQQTSMHPMPILTKFWNTKKLAHTKANAFELALAKCPALWVPL